MRAVTDQDALAELNDLRSELSIMFREVHGPLRASFFGGNWTTVPYVTWALAAEGDRSDYESYWGPPLVRCMRFAFQTSFSRGGRILVWRQGFEFNVLSGGDRALDLLRLTCRLAILGENCVPIPTDDFTKVEGEEPRKLTKEQLEDSRI